MSRAVARIPVRGCSTAYLVLFDVQDQVPRSGSGGFAVEKGRAEGQGSVSRIRGRIRLCVHCNL